MYLNCSRHVAFNSRFRFVVGSASASAVKNVTYGDGEGGPTSNSSGSFATRFGVISNKKVDQSINEGGKG